MNVAAGIGEVLWTPDEARVAEANLTAFIRRASASDPSVRDYASLHRWSVADPRAFWANMWEFGEVIGERGERTLVDEDRMPGAQFFPDACHFRLLRLAHFFPFLSECFHGLF